MAKGQRNPKDFINSKTGRKQVMWTREEFVDIIGSISDLRDRAYISFVYLTACRENEPLEHYQERKILEEFKDREGRIERKWMGKTEYTKVPAFTVGQIVRLDRADKKSGKMIPFIDFQNLSVEKKRKKDYRESVRTIPVNALIYKRFLKYIFDYIKNNNLKRSSKLFTFGGRTALRRVDKWIGTNVHFLRHLRNTHLRIYHNYDETDLKKFNGWSDSRPAHIYLHINPLQLAEKQME